MTDYTVRELMDLALDGLPLPAEDVADLVFAQAAARRRARRSAALLGTAAAVAAVVGIAGAVALLPPPAGGAGQPGSGASGVQGVASAPRTPVASTPPSGAGTSATTSRSGASGSPTDTPSAGAPSTGSSGSTGSGGSGGDFYTVDAPQLAALLPPGTGTVRRMVEPARSTKPGDVVFGHGRLDGRYFIHRDGLTAYLDVNSYTPGTTPPQAQVGLSADSCTQADGTPANTDCRTVTLPGGARLITLSRPAGQDEPGSAHRSGRGYSAYLEYPDGRGVMIDDMSGISGAAGYGTPFAAPPLTQLQLDQLVENTVWFS